MNEKVTPEELGNALRCAASLKIGRVCEDCRYSRNGFTGAYCDTLQMCRDAADMVEAIAENMKPCSLCHGSHAHTDDDLFDIQIGEIIPMPAINLTTGEKEEKARPPFPALIIGSGDEGQDFLPIEFCPICGRKLK